MILLALFCVYFQCRIDRDFMESLTADVSKAGAETLLAIAVF